MKITKEKYLLKALNYLDRLYAIGLTQMQISIELGVNDRTIRKWESFSSVPSGIQFYNLRLLCKEYGA